jgi:hypothetical protein
LVNGGASHRLGHGHGREHHGDACADELVLAVFGGRRGDGEHEVRLRCDDLARCALDLHEDAELFPDARVRVRIDDAPVDDEVLALDDPVSGKLVHEPLVCPVKGVDFRNLEHLYAIGIFCE